VISRSCFDDAEVPLRPVAECAECLLIARALIGSDSPLGTVELDHDGALHNPGFVDLCRLTASEETATRFPHDGTGELDVLGELVRIADRTERVDPLGLWLPLI